MNIIAMVTYLKIAGDHMHTFMAVMFPYDSALF